MPSPENKHDLELQRLYEAEVLREIVAEYSSSDHLESAGVEIVCFTSLSKGRGRKSKAREVILVKYAGQTHEFDRERYPVYRNADSHAEEIFSDHKNNGHDPYDLYFDALLHTLARK